MGLRSATKQPGALAPGLPAPARNRGRPGGGDGAGRRPGGRAGRRGRRAPADGAPWVASRRRRGAVALGGGGAGLLLELVGKRKELERLAVAGLDGAQGAVPAGDEAAVHACGALGKAHGVADTLEADHVHALPRGAAPLGRRERGVDLHVLLAAGLDAARRDLGRVVQHRRGHALDGLVHGLVQLREVGERGPVDGHELGAQLRQVGGVLPRQRLARAQRLGGGAEVQLHALLRQPQRRRRGDGAKLGERGRDLEGQLDARLFKRQQAGDDAHHLVVKARVAARRPERRHARGALEADVDLAVRLARALADRRHRVALGAGGARQRKVGALELGEAVAIAVLEQVGGAGHQRLLHEGVRRIIEVAQHRAARSLRQPDAGLRGAKRHVLRLVGGAGDEVDGAVGGAEAGGADRAHGGAGGGDLAVGGRQRGADGAVDAAGDVLLHALREVEHGLELLAGCRGGAVDERLLGGLEARGAVQHGLQQRLLVRDARVGGAAGRRQQRVGGRQRVVDLLLRRRQGVGGRDAGDVVTHGVHPADHPDEDQSYSSAPHPAAHSVGMSQRVMGVLQTRNASVTA
ncbi:MAG: hypothetical protein J3K34DRAFT_424958 [Monoraphidium minutum]|nr:MAG: hypothetical protein J3K34DRAFT_424958 [Monoraphidium minutum]